MFYSTLVIASAFASLVSAQSGNSTGTLQINAGEVSYNLRQSWCRAQTNSCPQICGGQASPNTCDPNTLTFVCTCTNGNQPNISSYDQTIPSFVCAQYIEDCVDAHPNDLDGITACRSIVCGNQNASSGLSSSSSASASSTASLSSTASSEASQTASATESGSGGAAAASTSSGGAASATASGSAAVMNMAKNYGTGILAAGLFAVFGLAL